MQGGDEVASLRREIIDELADGDRGTYASIRAREARLASLYRLAPRGADSTQLIHDDIARSTLRQGGAP